MICECVFDGKVRTHLNSLPHTIPQLMSFSLMRLELDLGHDLVATAMSLLACSRVGQFPRVVLLTRGFSDALEWLLTGIL